MQTAYDDAAGRDPDADIVDGQTYNELGGGDIMARDLTSGLHLYVGHQHQGCHP
jgi:hypothetical protein